MKHWLLVWSALATVSTSTHAAPENTDTYSQAQVASDLDVLYQSLLDTHYDPFAYTSAAALDAKHLSISRSLTKSDYSALETFSLYQQLVSSLNNGHTELDFPVAPYIQFAQSGGRVFPLDLAFEDGRALVRANYSGNDAINTGSEVVSINGTPIDRVLAKIASLISAERPYFKRAKLEALSFPRYYWYAWGHQDQFDIEIRRNEQIRSHRLRGIPVFDGFEEAKDEVLRAQQKLTFYGQTAYLDPGPFSGDETKYRAFIEQAFQRVSDRGADDLIIDLRYNSGGNDSFSDYLVAHVADKPFKWNARFKLRTSELLKRDTRQKRDLSSPFWRSVIDNKSGVRYDFPFPPTNPVDGAKRFTGRVYVLINRQTHSQAAVTAAQLQDYGWATVIGEETGDFPSLYASQFQYALPETGIAVKIAKGYIVRVSGSEAREGVIPDLYIRDHLLDAHDEILTGALAHIRGRQRDE